MLTADELRTLKLMWGTQYETFRASLIYGVYDLAHVAVLEREGYIQRHVVDHNYGDPRIKFIVASKGGQLIASIFEAGIESLLTKEQE